MVLSNYVQVECLSSIYKTLIIIIIVHVMEMNGKLQKTNVMMLNNWLGKD